MKSEKFKIEDYGSKSKAQRKMEKRANELRVVEHAKIISVSFCDSDDAWILFYEPNVGDPIISKKDNGITIRSQVRRG